MATLRVYKSTVPSIVYICKNGKPCNFIQGVYRTDVETEIAELDTEIALGHPQLFIDAKEREIDSAMVDPVAALRASIIADYLATQAKATDPEHDMGSYEAGQVVPASTKDIAAAIANGASIPFTPAKK